MDEADDLGGIVWRDAITNLMTAFVCIAILALLFMNPPVDADKMEPPGSIVASIVWPEGDDDVDLWVTGPGEPLPIGYSNKGGVLWNLLRDDLGNRPDYTPLNYEHSFTRGMPPGEYTVNVHCYRCPNLPIDVILEVSKKGGSEGAMMHLIASSTITLTRNKEEKTGLHFELNDSGGVVPGSLDTIFRPLRDMGGK